MSRTTLLKGNPISVEGPELKPGEKAPNFTLQASAADGLGDVTLSNFTGKTLLLSVVPSLDTPVCSIQTKKFNQLAAQLPADVEVITVSTDLPFAQSRFCGAEGIEKLKAASDHRDANFGKAYGVLMTEGPFNRILSRAVFVIDPHGVLKYVQYVPEVANEPDYDMALAALA
jgi:thiol peroxidase